MTIRRVACFAVALSLFACGSRPAAAATPPPARRRALLVGIDDYSASRLGQRRSAVPDRGWQNLYGAVNDVEAMREMLLALHGFRSSDIVVLENQAATRAAILRGIETQLELPARKGDIVLFYYSGHGSQVPNSKSAEPDKLDESLVPADSRLGAPDIRDKELRRLFNRILDRGARLTVILDSCHSGSGARGIPTDGRARAVRRDPRDIADAAVAGPWPESRGALVIAAAQDLEVARETHDDRGSWHGVFSWAWLRAMRRAAPGEPAVDTFLRAQALIRAERPSQDPVIAGTAEARSTPFLCSGRAPIRRSALAVERVGSDGNVIVQGGWAHGLTVGSELRLARGGNVRLEVREMLGLGRCQARLLGPRGMPAGLTSGALLEIAGWASPPARPLRVWMPKTTSAANLVEWGGELAHVASQRHVRWIDDPIAETPMHLLRWRSDGWELLAQNGEVIRFPAGVAPGAVVAKLSPASSLFVQLPVPAWLVKAIDVGPGTSRAAIQPVDHPEEADYLLAGRFALGALEYAWVRPLVTQRDRQRTPLPLASAWRPASAGVGAALGLQDAVLQLRRIYAWQSLESPPGSRAAYDLVLRRRSDGVPVRDRVLVGGQRYTVALHACPGSPPKPRYIYAFLIDSYGRSVLLYPRGGSVENRFPLPSLSPPPAEIALDAPFDVREPYGVDTYFLLTTDEQLPDPSILEWDGVRGRPAVKTALEELLTETSSVNRSAQPVRTMANWSIDRLLFESIPAKPKGSS